MKRILILLIAAIILSSCIDTGTDNGPIIHPPNDIGQKTQLNVPFSFQETEVWCWAAVIEMVSDYYGHSVAQCQILSAWYGYQCCLYPNYCTTTGSEGQIVSTLSANRIHSEYIPYTPSLDKIKSEINAGRPVVAFYRGSFAGHVVLIVGFTSKNYLIVYDPYYGQQIVPYGSSFVYGQGYNTMYFTSALINVRPY